MANINARIERMEVVLLYRCAVARERMVNALFDVRDWIVDNGTPEQLTAFDAWGQSEPLTPEQQAMLTATDTPHDARLTTAIAVLDGFPPAVIDRVTRQRRALATEADEPKPEIFNNVT